MSSSWSLSRLLNSDLLNQRLVRLEQEVSVPSWRQLVGSLCVCACACTPLPIATKFLATRRWWCHWVGATGPNGSKVKQLNHLTCWALDPQHVQWFRYSPLHAVSCVFECVYAQMCKGHHICTRMIILEFNVLS